MSTASATNSTSFSDVGGWPSWTFSAPASKTFLVHVDVGLFVSVVAGGGGYVFLQLVNTTTSTNYAPADNMIFFLTTGVTLYKSLHIPVAMNAGNNVLKLQWKVNAATTTGDTDNGSTPRAFTVTG